MKGVTAGIDVGTSAVKCALFAFDPLPDRPGEDGGARLLATTHQQVRRRNPERVVEEVYAEALEIAGVAEDEPAYIATTGESDRVRFGQGHFYGMTTHARGARWLFPEARAVLDVGAMHSRAVRMDARSKVLDYRMSSQCASGSGQFLENISRYLGVGLEEVGPLSLSADDPEPVSSICAVLAETDVINMVSRGVSVPNILQGIHRSMAGRLMRLLTVAKVEGVVAVTGGLAADVGLIRCLRELAGSSKPPLQIQTHPLSLYAGALGAALWAGYRHRFLAEEGALL